MSELTGTIHSTALSMDGKLLLTLQVNDGTGVNWCPCSGKGNEANKETKYISQQPVLGVMHQVGRKPI